MSSRWVRLIECAEGYEMTWWLEEGLASLTEMTVPRRGLREREEGKGGLTVR